MSVVTLGDSCRPAACNFAISSCRILERGHSRTNAQLAVRSAACYTTTNVLHQDRTPLTSSHASAMYHAPVKTALFRTKPAKTHIHVHHRKLTVELGSSSGCEPFCYLMCHAALRSSCGCEHFRQDSHATIRLSASTRLDMPQTHPKSDWMKGYFQCSLRGKAAISFRGLSAR